MWLGVTGRRTAAGLGKNGPPGPALRDLLSGSSGAVPSPIRSRHDLVQAGVRELSPISPISPRPSGISPHLPSSKREFGSCPRSPRSPLVQAGSPLISPRPSGSSGAVPDLPDLPSSKRDLPSSPLVQAGVRELSPISPISPISGDPDLRISGSPSPAAEFAFLAVRLYSGLHRLPVTPEQVARERLGAAIHRRVGDDLRLGRLVETLEAPSDYPPDPGITSVTAPSRVNIVLRFTQTTTATRTKNQVS